MDLQELQLSWQELDKKLSEQQQLTKTLIMEMTKGHYHSKIKSISTYESAGAVICFAAAFLILLNFTRLDTWYLMLCGIITMGYLVILPWVVLQSIRNLRQIDVLKNSYKDIILKFNRAQQRFLKIQRTGIYLNVILVFVSLPVLVKLMKDKNIFLSNAQVIYWYIPIMLVFLVIFSKWGYGKYKAVTDAAYDVLKSMDKN